MKLTWMLSLVLALVAGSAQAVVNGEWERPVSHAKMNIVEAHPSMARVRNVELVMTQREGAISPTGFVLMIDHRPMVFEVSRAQSHSCGDVLYIGLNVSSAAMDPRGHIYRLAVVDHSRSTCVGNDGQLHSLPVTYPLEVVLMDGNDSLLEMNGKPEPMITAMTNAQ